MACFARHQQSDGSRQEIPKKCDHSPCHFKGAIGAEEEMAMCSFTIDDANLGGIFHKANQRWKELHGDKHFGITYTERTPRDWATPAARTESVSLFENGSTFCRETEKYCHKT
eukprot:7239929-Ditylum_brightwellii.AAC.1